MSDYASCRDNSSAPVASDSETGSYHGENYFNREYQCSYAHNDQWDSTFDYGPDYVSSPWYGYYNNSTGHSASSWDNHYKDVQQHESYDSDISYSYCPGDHVGTQEEHSQDFEEHHMVQGNSIRNGPYTHENYRIQNEDGSYHGNYLWNANRLGHGRHIHQGTYGMERNSRQDIHYDYEAEYNLDEETSHRRRQENPHYQFSRSSQKSSPSRKRSGRTQDTNNKAFEDNGTRRREHRGSPKGTTTQEVGQEENWRTEIHFLRGYGMTVYTEESHTDGRALAKAWMKMDRQRDGGTWGS